MEPNAPEQQPAHSEEVAASVQPPVRVYADGIFDVFHCCQPFHERKRQISSFAKEAILDMHGPWNKQRKGVPHCSRSERAESVRHCKYVWSKCRIRHSWEAACCIHTLHMINKACNICAKHRGNGKPTMANRCISMQRGLFVDSVLSMHLCTLCKKFASNVKVHHVSMPARGTPSLPALLFVNEGRACLQQMHTCFRLALSRASNCHAAGGWMKLWSKHHG
eukprot:1140532-Pelagomonas_calceolata.AAC.3